MPTSCSIGFCVASTRKRLLELEDVVVPPMVTCFSCIASRRAGLHLQAGAVDLVGQEDVGEDRPPFHRKLPGGLIVHLRAQHIRRE